MINIKKHSYILSKKGFILCFLGRKDNYLLGEIIYGRKKYPELKEIQIDGGKFYKYWSIQNKKKKLSGKVGEKTTYEKYNEIVSKTYPDSSYSEPLLGKVFRMDEEDIVKVWSPITCNGFDKSYRKIIKKLSNLLEISEKKILIAGSNMINPKSMSTNDFDILIDSKESSRKMVQQIRRLSTDSRFYEIIRSNHIHHRRFILDGIKICPFGSSKDEDIFEVSEFKKLEDTKFVQAKVVEDEDSFLSPSRYEIEVGGKILYLVSYCVGHTVLFKKDDVIEFELPMYEFTMRDCKVQANVCPIEGTWITVKGR